MRWWRIPLAALLLLAAAAAAQETEIATDGPGDLKVRVGDQEPTALPVDEYQHSDLLALRVVEARDTVRFLLQVVALPEQGAPFAQDTVYHVHFVHNDQPFRIEMYRVFGDQVYTWGFLQRFDPDDEVFNFVRFLPVQQDVDAGTLAVEVLREDLRDRQGAAPFPGRELARFHVESHLRTSDGFLNFNGQRVGQQWDVFDRMPDDGAAVTTLVFTRGLQQSGNAVLWSDAPMRASNGEASTFVFTVVAQNAGDEEDLFALEAVGVPSSWQVTVPERFLRVGAGETVEVPVILSTPFAHQHGRAESFHIHMTSQSDASAVGRVELGIRYHEVPQPAGHHDEVWFHSIRFGEDNPFYTVFDNTFAGNGGLTYFNTLEDDPDDQAIPITGQYWGYGTREGSGSELKTRWSWSTFINPALEMGLDFDLAGTGTLRVPFTAQAPIPQASVSGILYHWRYDEASNDWSSTVVAEFPSSGPFDMEAGQTKLVEWEWNASEEADLLPYSKRMGLVFQFYLDTPVPHVFTGAEAPRMAPGGHARLPLLEYRDPVGDQYVAPSDLRFESPDAGAVNPGRTRLLTGTLHNDGDAAVRYRLTLEGVHVDWARLLVPPQGRIEPGAAVQVPVGVQASDDAIRGDAADLVVTAAAVDDPDTKAIGRYLVQVEEGTGLQDDADLAADLEGQVDQKAPAAPLGILLAGAAAVLAVVRVRRR